MLSEHWQKLEALCHQYPQQLRSLHEIQGLIFAVAAAPEIPSPQLWMGWVLISPEEVEENLAEPLSQALMDSFKAQLVAMRDQEPALPRTCDYHGGITMEDPLSQWMSGCLLGHQHLQNVWRKAWEKMQQATPEEAPQTAKDLTHLLRLFSTFANIPLALEQARERGQSDLEGQLPLIAQTLPRALKQYVDLAGDLAAFLPNQFETFTSGK
ncbi:UPF0149 family protein [Aliiglaciecola sp. CAU 1673]|uniref:UPF0149 family protein n=1 Tax=Aliiglaciecola sp. CAU 1673 TaxID=3032595 RepID=UPI0023D9B32E|nr:UPF0149 family protein [Aliiglaciecola sp. CAU 1673]MDF2178648.1 UPF0149 family protein [Aliiglaciecola sp. CAU 1673]